MLINLCQGGESTITVYGPANASISASGGGESWSGSIGSGGSVSFKVHTIADWSVSCSSGGSTKTDTVPITAFGQSESTSFSFAYIKVHTHPGASVKATKGSTVLGPYTADSSGNYNIPVPYSGIDSTAWTVRATDVNATSVYEEKSATTSSTTSTPDVYPLYRIPIIQVSWSGGSATSYGNGMDNGYAKVTGTNSWKMWVKSSCTVKFLWLKTKVSFWAIGKGGNGASHWGSSGYYGGGGGGGGGQVATQNNMAVSTGTNYATTVGASGSSFGSIISVGNGENGGAPSGGASGGGSGNGSTGEWVNDHSYPPSSGGGGDGGNGVYAFGDSSFDGVVYGHGGGGGKHSVQQGGYHSSTAGSGGGGGGSSNVGRTDGNVGIICMKPGDNI